jgi:putative transposase
MARYIQNLMHFVWATAGREPLIGRSWQDRLYGYIGGVLKNKNARLLVAGGMADHVHLLVSLPGTMTLAEAVNAMKANSSRWIHENIAQCQGFAWQVGYGAFSVSQSARGKVSAYIQEQERHHQRWKFTEEYKMLLDAHGIAYDERYLWE